MSEKAKAEEENRRLHRKLDLEFEQSFPASDAPKIISPRGRKSVEPDDGELEGKPL